MVSKLKHNQKSHLVVITKYYFNRPINYFHCEFYINADKIDPTKLSYTNESSSYVTTLKIREKLINHVPF